MNTIDRIAEGASSSTSRPLCDLVLIDDAADLRLLVRVTVERDSRFHVVAEGGTGRAAIELARRHRPKLLLLDVSMPEMDGLTALPLIREASPDTKVVMFSGFHALGLAPAAMELGAVGYIDKSLPIVQLAQRLADLIGLQAAPPQPAPAARPAAGPETQGVLDQHLERFRMAFDSAALPMASLTLAGSIVLPTPRSAISPEPVPPASSACRWPSSPPRPSGRRCGNRWPDSPPTTGSSRSSTASWRTCSATGGRS